MVGSLFQMAEWLGLAVSAPLSRAQLGSFCGWRLGAGPGCRHVSVTETNTNTHCRIQNCPTLRAPADRFKTLLMSKVMKNSSVSGFLLLGGRRGARLLRGVQLTRRNAPLTHAGPHGCSGLSLVSFGVAPPLSTRRVLMSFLRL